jgi:phenylacetate-CoA ligase
LTFGSYSGKIVVIGKAGGIIQACPAYLIIFAWRGINRLLRSRGREMLRSLRIFNELRTNVHKDPLVLKALQLKKLKKLLVHAYKNTDYYKRLFDEHGFNPNHLKSAEDLRKVPILEKSDVQNNCDSIVSKKADKQKLSIHATSVSTGMPLKIFCDKTAESYNRALRYRSYVENGLSPKDIVAEITSPINVNYRKLPIQKLGFFRRYKLSILDDETDLFERMNQIKPDVIECYPSVLNLIAQTCNKKDLQFRPKVIFTIAELLLPAWRRNITGFFDCDVRDVYGSVEFHRLAWECEKHEGWVSMVPSPVFILN